VMRVSSRSASAPTAPPRWARSAADLALMDAGVPLKAPVSRRRHGPESRRGDEVRIPHRHPGHRRIFLGEHGLFKVAGTEKGNHTALQQGHENVRSGRVKTNRRSRQPSRPPGLHSREDAWRQSRSPVRSFSPHAPRLLSSASSELDRNGDSAPVGARQGHQPSAPNARSTSRWRHRPRIRQPRRRRPPRKARGSSRA